MLSKAVVDAYAYLSEGLLQAKLSEGEGLDALLARQEVVGDLG